ncbi:MAG: hypothetical protein AB1810_00915 [Pseudomonadota bacterium]
MRTHLPHTIRCTLLAAGLLVAMPVAAEGGGPRLGVEADQISVTFGDSAGEGRVMVQGCKGCPLHLTADAGTVFSANGAAIDRKQARNHSGQAGAVVYDRDTKHVIKINW